MKRTSPSTLPALNSTSELSAERGTRFHGHQILLAKVLWCAMFICSLAVFVISLLFNQFYLPLTILLIVATSVWFAVSVVIFWHKSHDRIILYFSLAYMMLGVIYITSYPAGFPRLPLAWKLPLDMVEFLPQASYLIFYIFPDGRFVPCCTHWLALGWIAVSLDENLQIFSVHLPMALAFLVPSSKTWHAKLVSRHMPTAAMSILHWMSKSTCSDWTSRTMGVGLVSMHERAEELGGTFLISQSPREELMFGHNFRYHKTLGFSERRK